MVFQWYLFVLLIAVGIFSRETKQVCRVTVDGQYELRYGWVPVLMVTIPLIYLAATRADTIGDTYAYMVGYRDTPTSLSGLIDAVANAKKDKGFTVFNFLLKAVIGSNVQVYFGVIAAICLLCVVWVYKRYSCNFLMSMFLFFASSDYIQWTHNGMRQFIAVCMIFAGTDWLMQKKYLQYLLLVLLASTIHASALLMIPICFIVQGKAWNKKNMLLLAAVLGAISLGDRLTNIIADFMEDSQYSGEVDQFLSTEGTNLLRVAVYSIPTLLALVFRKQIAQADNPVINLSVGMSVASMGAYIISAFTSGMFIGRIPIFFSLYNYILLPWIVEHVFEERSAKLIYAVLILCYLFFYYYQVAVSWGLYG